MDPDFKDQPAAVAAEEKPEVTDYPTALPNEVGDTQVLEEGEIRSEYLPESPNTIEGSLKEHSITTVVKAEEQMLGNSFDPSGSSSMGSKSSHAKGLGAKSIKQDPDENPGIHPRQAPVDATESAPAPPFLKRSAPEEANTSRPSKMQNRPRPGVRAEINSLKYVRTLIQEHLDAFYLNTSYEDWVPIMARIRDKLHDMMFYSFVNDYTVAQSQVLSRTDGLERLYNAGPGPGRFGGYASDVQDFAFSLAMRWTYGDYDPDLLRGIRVRQGNRENRTSTTRTVDPDYAFKVDARYIGEGDLFCGDWWPYQVCCVRDGAHGSLEAGICGSLQTGAYSIVLSGCKYNDVDNGDTIEYCGTKGKANEASIGTSQLLRSYELDSPIRVLRSHKLPKENPYRPLKGIRYDGLYKIVSHELWDGNTSMFRFTLERKPNQRPIPYEGPARRPTQQEVAEFDKLRLRVN